MRVEIPHFRFLLPAFFLCILISGAPILRAQPNADSSAQTNNAAVPHPALLFFSQHRLPEDAWTALFAAMRATLPASAEEVPALDAQVELIRGDGLAHGAVVPQSVNVYLHGDCHLSPQPESFSAGQPLGWVVKVGPQIEPVIHVECTQIGQELSRSAEWMSKDARTATMSEAMARVILHEWAHIATQSGAHGKKGITKARFGVDDLVVNNRQAQVYPQYGLP
jgi:hypothetical protein